MFLDGPVDYGGQLSRELFLGQDTVEPEAGFPKLALIKYRAQLLLARSFVDLVKRSAWVIFWCTSTSSPPQALIIIYTSGHYSPSLSSRTSPTPHVCDRKGGMFEGRLNLEQRYVSDGNGFGRVLACLKWWLWYCWCGVGIASICESSASKVVFAKW